MSEKQIAILATGNEIVSGDVLNSNATAIAAQLTQSGFCVGVHMVATDNQADIECAMHFLQLKNHAVIVIGGLGPTSDDRTRFALAAVIEQDLLFDEPSWQLLVERFVKLGIALPETNRQQCLFPQGATIIPNPWGSAAACEVAADDAVFFLLPGPPKECLPLLADVVIARLKQLQFCNERHRASWLLLGLGEGSAAQSLDVLLQDIPAVELGYRACFPYLEVKLAATQLEMLQQAVSKVLPHIAAYIVSDRGVVAADQLRQLLITKSLTMAVDDRVTRGRLQACLTTPASDPFITFVPGQQADIQLVVSGLDEFWRSQSIGDEATLTVDCEMDGVCQQLQHTVRLRGEHTLQYVIEWLCWQLVLQLRGAPI